MLHSFLCVMIVFSAYVVVNLQWSKFLGYLENLRPDSTIAAGKIKQLQGPPTQNPLHLIL